MVKSLPHVLKELIQSSLHWKLDLLKSWPHLMGKISRYARIEKIYDDTIIIGVYDACWLHELHMLSTEIKQSINEYLKDQKIKNIRFKQVTKHLPIKCSSSNHSGTLSKIVTLNIQQERALKKIQDKELAHALTKFWNRCAREKS